MYIDVRRLTFTIIRGFSAVTRVHYMFIVYVWEWGYIKSCWKQKKKKWLSRNKDTSLDKIQDIAPQYLHNHFVKDHLDS